MVVSVSVDTNIETKLEMKIETMRLENNIDHKEIIQKLNVLCTKVAVTETKVHSLEGWKGEHTKDHEGDSRARMGYIVGFVVLGVSVAVTVLITVLGG